SEISWIDWKLAVGAEGEALTAFVARLAALRHRYPILRWDHFLHGKDEPAPGVLDIAWFDEQGQLILPDAWDDPERRLLVLRRAIKGSDGSLAILACFFNPEGQDHTFTLPPPRSTATLLLDSADPFAPERGAAYVSRLAPGQAVRDPASRAQADDAHGPSLVVDPACYRW